MDSVLAQTLEEKEIILVDDGSQDTSPQICDRYAQQYPGLIHVIHKQNEGLGMARNSGLDIARGGICGLSGFGRYCGAGDVCGNVCKGCGGRR